MTSTILLATTCRWLFAARLAVAFNKQGCNVDIVCPSGHPATLTKAVRTVYPYKSFAPLSSFRSAISLSNSADIVIPCDDLARAHLYHLWLKVRSGDFATSSRILIERSLGNETARAAGGSRHAIIRLAGEEGLPVPASGPVSKLEELRQWTKKYGFPVVLKSDGTSGGTGVQIAWDEISAERAFIRVKSSPSPPRAIKRALIDGDRTLLVPALRRRNPEVSVQSFVDGQDLTMSVACWHGELLASIGAEVLQVRHPRGPASVMRLSASPVMHWVAEKMIRRLGLSGLYGFDFVLESETRRPILVEMNLRATPTAHLQLGPERDLVASLAAALEGKATPCTEPITNNDVIAMFPTEFERDAISPWFHSAFHDVPWDEPALIREALGKDDRKICSLYSTRTSSAADVPSLTGNEARPAVD